MSRVRVNGKWYPYKSAAIAECAVVGRNVYLRRMKEGMTFEEAITTPLVIKRPKTGGKYCVFGEWMSLSQAVIRYGRVSRQTVYARMKKYDSELHDGTVTLEQILTTPEGSTHLNPYQFNDLKQV